MLPLRRALPFRHAGAKGRTAGSRHVVAAAGTECGAAALRASRLARRWRVAGGLGLGVLTVAGGGALWLERCGLNAGDASLSASSEEERALAGEREQHRRAELERLVSQASWWRLAELVLTMLPVVFCWPVWLVDPNSFWQIVAVRVDSCGPTFVKLAQWLATRRDIFPDSACEAFSRLHHQVNARWSQGVSSSEVEASLRNSEVALRSLEPQPHASGSIAEVFFGVLEDGTDVAVKCLRPGVRALLEADLAWLLKFSLWADRVDKLRLLGVRRAAEEFCEHVQMQTDFETEASHLRRFRANFADSEEAVRFPMPLYVTPEALVLSREKGKELAEVFRAASSGPRSAPASTAAAAFARADEIRQANGIPASLSRQIARESMSCYMRMIFNDKFIHGDLHPGNIMLEIRHEGASGNAAGDSSCSEERAADSHQNSGLLARLRQRLPGSRPPMPSFEIVILDAGLAIPLQPEKVEVLRSLAIAIIYADFSRAAEILYAQSPDSSGCLDPAAFKSRLAKAFRDCRKNVWEEGFVQVSDACLEALRLVQYYNVGLDTTLTWTLFGMLSVEGSARQLDPEVDCAQAATRYILTVPSLVRELRAQSWQTSKHMLAEMALSAVGVDYWAWRNRQGLTWSDLQS